MTTNKKDDAAGSAIAGGLMILLMPVILALSFGINYLLAMALTWAIHACGGPQYPLIPVTIILMVACLIMGCAKGSSK